MKNTLTLLLILMGLHSAAQKLSGRILDDKKEPAISVVVQVFRNDTLKGGNVSDFDGNYEIKPLDPGEYTVLVTTLGYDSMIATKVAIPVSGATTLNFNLRKSVHRLKGNQERYYRRTPY